MPRLVFISDTHNHLKDLSIPDGDILIHCGDFTSNGTADEISQFNDQLLPLPHPHKIVIAGNHDLLFEDQPAYARRLLTAAHYLQDESTTIDGLKIYGSPWQPRFFDWAFNLDRNSPEMQAKWDAIPADTDVLLTHGPPWGILDLARPGRVGCQLLARRVKEVRPKVHAFGHIHPCYGQLDEAGTLYINACSVNEDYKAVNAPIVVDIPAKDSSR